MTVTTPMRLAILLCDTPAPPILEKYGDYHKIFDRWLRITAPVDFILEPFDVVKMEYPPEDAQYQAILLTGSGQSNSLLPSLNITLTFRIDLSPQPHPHTKTSNGSINWWTTPRIFHDRSLASKSSVRPTVSLSVSRALH